MPFALQVAARLLRREGPAPSWARLLGWIGPTLAIVGLVTVRLLDERSPTLLGLVGLAGLLGVVAGLVAWLRPLLVVAVLGLALGVASLFVVLGVASGVEQALIRSMARLNGHAMISKYGLDFYEYDEIAARLEADPRIRAASPFVFGVGMAVAVRPDEDAAGGDPLIVSIKGVDPRRAAKLSGIEELFGAGDLDGSLRPAGPRSSPGIVLGTRLAKRLDVGLGDRVRVVVPEAIRPDSTVDDRPHHGEFEVLGLLDTGFAEFDASFALVHITAAQALVFGQRRASGIELELEDARLGTSITVARDLTDSLNRPLTQRGLLPLYRAASWADRSATLISIRQTKALVVVVLSLIIVVASGSLLGALLLLVRRERRHIGVLAAIGARPRQLFWIFESVGIAIGTLGSLLGLAWGAVSLFALSLLHLDLDADIYLIDHLPVAFVVSDLLIPTAIAVAVCGVVTGPVARRVSRTLPLALLR